ncbi:hypothetical protein HYALB_00007544 [Hymenoscyphus albidus]|uniref:Uncharacterized protein n=1 Tax=Hymenoscyphus albidus TaxID=595503 RepID=A0A9N9LMY0_9HELO|nr:hypothetical protein HYALB_00007544 [Hymenoscyphus albidus]
MDSTNQRRKPTPWRPPRNPFPVFRPYVSQLEGMRQRHNQEDNKAKSNRTFWLTWHNIETKAAKDFANEEWDTQQYEAELALFKKLWPGEFFPGQCPNQYYVSHLNHIEQKAHAAGIPRAVFNHICDHVARSRFEDPEPDTDIKQYNCEKALWNHFCKLEPIDPVDVAHLSIAGTKEEFPGISPYPNRINRAPVVSNAPGATSLDYYTYSIGLVEHQQLQKEAQAKPVSSDVPGTRQKNALPIKKEKFVTENFTMEDLSTILKAPTQGPVASFSPNPFRNPVVPTQTLTNVPKPNTRGSSTRTAASSSKAPQTPTQAFATGSNASSGKPTLDAPYVSKVLDDQVPLTTDDHASALPPAPHVAVVDSLFGHISKDMNLMVALSKALGCNIYSDRVPGSTNLTWIFVEAWPEWPGCETDVRVLERAHSIVEEWCKLSVEEFWKEVTSTESIDDGDQDGMRKRRRVA